MKFRLSYYLLAFFGLFLGCQITEGVLLVPYWQSLTAMDFYSYYQKFGPAIGRFYTLLTIVAALIPISLGVYHLVKKSPALIYSSTSSVFAILFVSTFYLYFKDANELFLQATLNAEDLKEELIVWSNWHWGRIVLELVSLVFLIFAFQRSDSES